MTLTELRKHVLAASDFAASVGWDQDDVVVTVNVSTGRPLVVTLIHDVPGQRAEVELQYT